jgi:hypothetical protein
MSEDLRNGADRRARRRGGRRDNDARTPWYRRRRLWLAAASIAFVSWRRVRNTAKVFRETE